MKGITNNLLLLILPVSLYMYSGLLLKDVQGPFYINYYDPSYVYLISSLNLSQGYNVIHVDHPGTTTQVIGAIVIKFYHALSNNSIDLATDVLTRSEDYLKVINGVFILTNCLLLYLLGVFTCSFSKSLPLAFLMQLSPFVSWEISYGLIIASSDNLLIGVSMCYLILIYYYYYKIDDKLSVPLIFILLFAVVSGFGVATKLNFIPMVMIPLILIPKFKNKFLFLVFCLVSFLIFVLPAISNSSKFLNWFINLILHSGLHGTGETIIIDSSTFLENMMKVFLENYFFLFTYLLTAATLLISVITNNSQKHSTDTPQKKISMILFSVFSSMTLMVTFLGKHYSQYYLIPSIMLCVLTISICADFFCYKFYGKLFSSFKTLLYTLIIMIIAWSLWGIEELYFRIKDQKNEALKLVDIVDNSYPDDMLISEIGSQGEGCAYAFSISYAGSADKIYRQILSEKLPAQIFFNRYSNNIFSLHENLNIKSQLSGKKRIIFQSSLSGPPEELLKKINSILGVKNSSCKKVFENSYKASVYEIYPGIKN